MPIAISVPVTVQVQVQTAPPAPVQPVVGEPVDIQYRTAGTSAYADLGTFVTGPSGIATVLPRPMLTVGGTGYDFIANFAGDLVGGLGPSSGTRMGYVITASTQLVVTISFP